MHEGALKLISQLTPDEGLAILRALARQDAQLAARIVETITAHLSDDAPQTPEDAEGIAEDLVFELNLLEVEEVWDRAGQTRYGYVEPSEAADEMMQEVLEPYLEEMKRYQRLGMHEAARYTCMGLLAGLYRFETEEDTYITTIWHELYPYTLKHLGLIAEGE
ncbi:MAG: hypothetical protein ACE5HA_07645 [Anaerolineae bacterium]